MTSFPYPGAISGINQQNLESVRFKNPVTLIIFDFQWDMSPKQIAIMPVNSVVRALQPIFIKEQFNLGNQQLEAGTKEDNIAFGAWLLRMSDEAISLSDSMGQSLMEPTLKSTPVIISIHYGNTDFSTRGSGWGFFEYINLSLVQRI